MHVLTRFVCHSLNAAVVCLLGLQGGNGASAGESKLVRQIDNPYCDVATYERRDVIGWARALIRLDGKPVIYLTKQIDRSQPFGRFLLAHECCHHTRGHLKRLRRKRREGVTLLFTLSNRQTELDADCCAALLLSARGDKAAIRAAKEKMAKFGTAPTGPSYPAGDMRVSIISRCAATRSHVDGSCDIR